MSRPSSMLRASPSSSSGCPPASARSRCAGQHVRASPHARCRRRCRLRRVERSGRVDPEQQRPGVRRRRGRGLQSKPRSRRANGRRPASVPWGCCAHHVLSECSHGSHRPDRPATVPSQVDHADLPATSLEVGARRAPPGATAGVDIPWISSTLRLALTARSYFLLRACAAAEAFVSHADRGARRLHRRWLRALAKVEPHDNARKPVEHGVGLPRLPEPGSPEQAPGADVGHREVDLRSLIVDRVALDRGRVETAGKLDSA